MSTTKIKVSNISSVIGTGSVVLSASPTLTGTTNTTNLAYTGTLTGGTGVLSLGTDQIYKDANGNVGIGTSSPTCRLDVGGTVAIKLPSGTTAQRPASPVGGMIRFNTELGNLEQYTSSGWGSIAPPPTFTSVSPLTYNGEQGTVFTINGSGFGGDATVKFITAQGVEYTSSIVTRVSSGQLTATTPQDFTVANEPLAIKLIQGSGSVITTGLIDCGGVPTWNTSAGTLTTIDDAYGSYSTITTLSAGDPDAGATVAYSITSGALPGNVSLNSSTGVISGDPDNITSPTTYNFTASAIDNAGNQTSRTFAINVNPTIDGSSSSRAATSASAIKTLTGTTSDGVYWINLPTVGPTQVYCIMNSAADGGGWMMGLKGSRTNSFAYTSGYWTGANTLNAGSLDRGDADAKFDVFNYFQAKDILGLWPDLSNGGVISGLNYGTVWQENNYYAGGTRITPISFFNTVNMHNPNGRAVRGSQWNGGSQFSSQGGYQFYGFNYTGNNENRARWGFGWNNEGDQGSNDITGGIGLHRPGQSAGDFIYCCQDVTGFNRSARFEIYVR